MATPDRAKTTHERQAAILERIATNAPLQGTLDELVVHVEDQIPGAIGSLLLLSEHPSASTPAAHANQMKL